MFGWCPFKDKIYCIIHNHNQIRLIIATPLSLHQFNTIHPGGKEEGPISKWDPNSNTRFGPKWTTSYLKSRLYMVHTTMVPRHPTTLRRGCIVNHHRHENKLAKNSLCVQSISIYNPPHKEGRSVQMLYGIQSWHPFFCPKVANQLLVCLKIEQPYCLHRDSPKTPIGTSKGCNVEDPHTHKYAHTQ